MAAYHARGHLSRKPPVIGLHVADGWTVAIDVPNPVERPSASGLPWCAGQNAKPMPVAAIVMIEVFCMIKPLPSALTQTEGAAEVSPPFVKPTMEPQRLQWWACPRDSGPLNTFECVCALVAHRVTQWFVGEIMRWTMTPWLCRPSRASVHSLSTMATIYVALPSVPVQQTILALVAVPPTKASARVAGMS